jgi:hypothetical protein
MLEALKRKQKPTALFEGLGIGQREIEWVSEQHRRQRCSRRQRALVHLLWDIYVLVL